VSTKALKDQLRDEILRQTRYVWNQLHIPAQNGHSFLSKADSSSCWKRIQ
jgi:hypothetical protein